MENIDPRLMTRIEKEGVGPFLRRAREEKEIPLRSVSEHTRIRTYYLESIESGDFDRLPTGPVGLGFVRAFADTVGVDSKAVVESYKRETTGVLQPGDHELEQKPRTIFSPPPQTNRFSSAATFIFVLVFLFAGGGLLWFMKGRTKELVPIESIVGRIKSAVAPVAETPPQPNAVNEEAKNEGGTRKEADAVEKKVTEPERPPASTANLKEPSASDKEEMLSPAAEKPPVQASAPVQENPVAEGSPPAQQGPVVQEAPPSPPQGSAPVQESAQGPQSAPARGNTAAQETPPVSENPSAQASAPAADKVARNTAPNVGAAPQGEQTPATPAPAPPAPASIPLTLKIFATEDTWLRIVVDAKNTEELLLLAGKERNWKASEKFVVTVGNVSGTQMSLNGSEVELPKNSSNVLRDFIITKKYLN